MLSSYCLDTILRGVLCQTPYRNGNRFRAFLEKHWKDMSEGFTVSHALHVDQGWPFFKNT